MIFLFHGKPLDRSRKAVSEGYNSNNIQVVAFSLFYLGSIYEHLKQYKEAYHYYSQCEKLRIRLNDQEGLGNVYNCLGIINQNLNNYKDAIQNFELCCLIREKYLKKNSYDIANIPFDLIPGENKQIDIYCFKEQVSNIERGRIELFLEQLEYTLYYLDYETLGPAVPLFNTMNIFSPVDPSLNSKC